MLPERSIPVDVLVVGAGGAGVAAALAAVEAGASVRLVEALPMCGGTTALSVGSIMAACSRLQRRQLQGDSPAEHGADLWRMLDKPDPSDRHSEQIVDLLVTAAGTTVDWLERHGVRLTGPFRERGHAFPRMHMLAPSPRSALAVLVTKAEAAGVGIMTSTRVTDLSRRDGAWQASVVGDGADLNPAITARTVVLASGDSSAALGSPLAPPFNYAANGDARRIAQSLDASIVAHVHISRGLRRYAWPHIELLPVVFDLGMRLESADGKTVIWPGPHTDYADALAYLNAGYYFFTAGEAALARLSASAEILATFPEIGFATWRDLTATGEVSFAPDGTARLGPFGIFTMLTDGGIVVDNQTRVTSSDGSLVPGLFAAGAAGWGPLRLRGHGHHLTWSFVSGLTAGSNAARLSCP